MNGAIRLALAVIALCACLVSARAAWAQGADSTGNAEPAETPANADAEDGDSDSSGTDVGGEVQIRVGRFGVANAARVGDWCGVLVEVQDSSPKIRNVVVRMSIRDADGDITNTQRVAIPNPGKWEGVWLYTRLPFSVEGNASVTFTAHEAIERGGASAAESAGDGEDGSGSAANTNSQSRFSAGRILGRTEFPVNRFLPPYVSTMAVVGERAAGLEQYPNTRLSNSSMYEMAPPLGHELIEVVRGLKVLELPDRWMGWAQFPVIAWTSGSSEQPSAMSESQAEAIRQWVRRGGHLIVVLPSVGQGWLGASAVANPLTDIMPTVNVRREEGVDLDTLRRLLTLNRDVQLPKSSTVQYLIPNANTDQYSAMPILNGENGEAVVVRRLVGTGAVTVVGLDVTVPTVSDVGNALQAHVFWGRILGKQMPTATRAEIVQKEKASPPQYPMRWTATDLDDYIQEGISLSAKSAAGLLLAFIVFLLYWLIAGPLGYFGLKAKGKKQHSWLAFVGATILFTGIAWGGANLLKGRNVTIRHVTMLEHVYGQSNPRARSWANVYFPTYGDVQIRVPAAGALGQGANLVSAWESPNNQSSLTPFPDARGYTVDARNPSAFEVPMRSTSKQFQLDWAGALPGSWKMPLPESLQNPDGSPVRFGSEIRIVERKGKIEKGERTWELEGRLTHGLPVALEDVNVIINFGLYERPRLTSMAFSETFAYAVPGGWKAGDVLDLSKVFPSKVGEEASLSRWLEGRPSLSARGFASMGQFSAPEKVENLDNAMFLGAIPVKEHQTQSSGGAAWIRTNTTHTYDISRWLTQPCVIISARMQNVPCPVEVMIDGDPAPTDVEHNSGMVLLKWIFPLPPRPPGPMQSVDEAPEGVPSILPAEPGPGPA